jgi:uncharacterized membrane protein HdeD (DUF308 family)
MGEQPGAATGEALPHPSGRGPALYGLGLVRLAPRLWWVPVAQGAIGIAAALAIATPGRTLTLVGLAAGIYLLTLGLLRIAGAAAMRAERSGDAPLQMVLGVGAVAAGLVAMARPGDGPMGVALPLGVYLTLVGLLTLTTVMRIGPRPARVALALLDVVAGVVLVSWPPPGIGLGALAIVLSAYLVLRGAVDVLQGLTLRAMGSRS